MSQPAQSAAAPRPLTILVSRRVPPERAAEFEALMDEMMGVARGFPGHLGCYLVRPESGDLYHTVFAFDDDSHRRAWLESAERKALLTRLTALGAEEGRVHVLTGLETWFAVPAAIGRSPPPRIKMALVTWIGIFPLVLALSQLVRLIPGPLPPVLGVALVTALVTIAMTWVVMPTLARLLAFWLYPPPRN
jgi:antibiotic biosynthesis monooxygenase (ABM) superfamily enzyme